MNFYELSWGAVCFYYRSAGDHKYCQIMRDQSFISRLRQVPHEVSHKEFEEKVLLGYVNIENYDLLIGFNLAKNILGKIIELQPEISTLQDITLLNCDFSNPEVAERINKIYAGLYSIQGLWLTGVSKITHLLNDRLFVLLNLDISKYFGILNGDTNLIQWLKLTQKDARKVRDDFNTRGLSGTPENFLSEKLGYTSYGCEKSLVKFLDEFFWLRFGDNLPVPPKWIPRDIE